MQRDGEGKREEREASPSVEVSERLLIPRR